jgi:hypothetical protein
MKTFQLFRKDVRSGKKQITAANMSLTDREVQQFWPIYDQYNVELATITDSKCSLIKGYAQSYASLTGEHAEQYAKRARGCRAIHHGAAAEILPNLPQGAVRQINGVVLPSGLASGSHCGGGSVVQICLTPRQSLQC